MDLSGKKAVVFGGTSGIGLAAALLLAQNGVEVTAVSRKPDKVGILPQG
jgi:NAD(P)-dependent dehydrogenase (short-subunit alcohol dehydrogenase family)